MAPHPPLTIPWPGWAPAWAEPVAFIVVALAVGILLYEALVQVARRTLKARDAFVRSLIVRTRAPVRFAFIVGAVSWSIHASPVSDGAEALLQHLLLIAFIVLVGWMVLTALDIATEIYLRRLRHIGAGGGLAVRKVVTQTRILRRSIDVLVLILTLAMALMTVPGVKQVGVSLLAAGGAAGIIVGLALQPVLSNVLAGVQIALTQPIRIDDVIQVQDQLGVVQEVRSTYVLIRLRDRRRLIVPLKFFLDQPFQNWTRERASPIVDILIYVDQRIPMARIAEAFADLARRTEGWDGQALSVDLNDIREHTLEIRCRVGVVDFAAATRFPPAFRARVLDWLQREFPAALPRNGVEFPAPEPAAPQAPPKSNGQPRGVQ